MKTEKQLHNYTKTQCAKNRIGFFKLECVGRNGFPDLLLAYDGYSIYVELKSPSEKGRLSPVQREMIKHLTNLGLEVYVCSQPEEIDAIISGLINS